ncbi:MAG: hypothetical protein JNM62_00525 [Flavobacteriales bacterium]|nr:hypothetical protein [Flavobacteriales bacterium]
MTLDATIAEGGSTSKVTDVWVSVNDEELGLWELPARVPILADGPQVIRVAAGVKRNGAFDDRLQYPYYTAWQNTVDLRPERSVTIDPIVRYQGAAIWAERFDDAGNLLYTAPSSDTTLIIYTPEDDPGLPRDGTTCAGFVLETGRDYIQLYTDQNFGAAFGPVYLELDYSTEVDLRIGYTYVQSGSTIYQPWITLVPTTGAGSVRWNKVYIDVSTYFNTSGISSRDFYVEAVLPNDRSSARAYLDNIKLVQPE